MKARYFLSLLALAMPIAANASTLLGDTVDVNYIYPTAGTIYTPYGVQTLVVPGTATSYGEILLTVTPTTISITDTGSGVSFQPSTYNGFQFTDLDQDFASVTLDPSSTLQPVGFSFSGDEFSVNLTALFVSGTDNITFDVTGGPVPSATPEPSSLVLLGTGILSAAGAARRRFKR